ncbi:MAG: hypothetical protein NUV32_05000 [Exilispira sp.]|nr:hypothetical protein [Exilispira sp.]
MLKLKIKLLLIILIFSLSVIFFLSAESKNIFLIFLEKNTISCSYILNFNFSQSFIDLLYFNNQAEIVYDILLIKKISTTLLSQDQKVMQVKYQYYLSYKNEKKIFTLYSSKEYYESSSIIEILKLINNMKIENIFQLDKTGNYFCSSDITINSLAPISPALFFLFLFYNPYNMKIANLISNIVSYENQK